MVLMDYNIRLNGLKLNYLLECSIVKDANMLGNTATIKVPGMAYGVALEIEEKLKRGNDVLIELGYDGELVQEFTGFITSISTDNTITINCEDAVYLTRQPVANAVYKNISVAEIATKVINQIATLNIKIGDGLSDIMYNKYTISNANAWDVLNKLKEENGLHIFFVGTVCHVNLKYVYKSGEVVYHFGRNVEEADLKYEKAEDKAVEVEVIGITRDNQKVKVNAGKTGGDKITVHRYNVTDKKALQAIAEQELLKYSYTGYEGTFKGWLTPYCSVGASVTITDPDYPSREGVYYAEKVEVRFNRQGGARIVNPTLKLSA